MLRSPTDRPGGSWLSPRSRGVYRRRNANIKHPQKPPTVLELYATRNERRIKFYQKVIRRFFGPACLYGQVLKTRRNDRIIKVERRALHGAARRFEDALNNSEDSSTLNTSFIERLNLTIRQSSAYLSRRTLSHARSTERLDEHLELLRCYYNFVRPHGALKFGREIRTPAMQAGLTTRRLTFRDIFFATTIPLWLRIEGFLLTGARNPVSYAPVPLPQPRSNT